MIRQINNQGGFAKLSFSWAKLSNTHWIGVYILFLFILPDNIFNLTSLYTFATPEYIVYDWLLLPISLLYVPLLLAFLLNLIEGTRQYEIKFLLFYSILIIYNCLRGIFIDDFLFTSFSIELFMVLLIGFIVTSLIFKRIKSYNDAEKYFSIFVYIHIIGLLFGLVTGTGQLQADYDIEHVAYHAQNLDVGGSGFIFGAFCIYNMFCKKKISIMIHIILPFLVLVLTGSRSSVYLVLVFGMIYLTFYNITRAGKRQNHVIKIRYICLFIVPILLIVCSANYQRLVSMVSNANIPTIERMLSINTLTGTDIFESDEAGGSVYGRYQSILAGIEVVKENKLGISFSFTDLQKRMQDVGYPTFPHSTILTYYLLMGLCFFFVCYAYMSLYIKLLKNGHNMHYLLLYIFLYSIFTGGVVVNFKIYFFYIYVLWWGWLTLVRCDSKTHNETLKPNRLLFQALP